MWNPSILLILVVSLWPWGVAHAGLFGRSDIAHKDGIKAFKRWADMIERHASNLGPYNPMSTSGRCVPNQRFACPSPQSDETLINTLQNSDRRTQLNTINAQMNSHLYTTDMMNYGVEDYWATLPQFEARDGDCEDYAIAKYTLLKRLGFMIADMRIVIVQDQNLDAIHAVLAVRDGKTTYILDNQIKEVLPDTEIHHYQPYYAINEHGWWEYTLK